MNPIIMYENYLTLASSINVSSTDSSPEYNKVNLYDYRSYTFWKAGSSSDQGIEVNFSTSKSITALALVNHDLDGCIISLKKVVDEIETTITSWTQSGNGLILKTFTSQSATQFKLYLSNASGKKIGIMMLGNYITFPYFPETPYYPVEETIKAENAISEGGYLLGSSIKYNPININPTFKFIAQSWVDSYFTPFWAHAKTLRPFVYAWDLTNYPNDVYFVFVTPDSVKKLAKSYRDYVDEITINMQGA